MVTRAAQIEALVQSDPVLKALSPADQQEVANRIQQFLIPDTTVYRWIVVGVIVALILALGIVGWSVIRGGESEVGLTAAIAVATGCFGGLIGALAPQKG